MQTAERNRIRSALLLSLAGYASLGYLIRREDFAVVALVFAGLFAAYLFLQHYRSSLSSNRIIAMAICCRLIFLFSVPALSDDYFRFVWDGQMTCLLHNPYTALPSAFIRHSKEVNDYLEMLYAGMNSGAYYTVYPPLLQVVFAFAAWLGGHNLLLTIAVMRIFILTAETGTMFLMKKLLTSLQLSSSNLFWYAMNPLVIVELTGNLHFEALVIFFLTLFLLFYVRWQSQLAIHPRQSFLFSAVAFGFSVLSKLIPLLFLPFLIRRFHGWQRGIWFGILGLTLVLAFLPFLDAELLRNTGKSLNLYFQKFEFNASIYYLVRALGYAWNGHHIIATAGPWLGLTVFAAVTGMALLEKKPAPAGLLQVMQWALTIYLLLATTVHPWYISPLVLFAVFTGYRFAILWSFLVVLSYAAYQSQPYRENIWFTGLEYLLVFGFLAAELWNRRKRIGEQYTYTTTH